MNVSARQVTVPGLVETVARTLAETGLEPDALWLELTEGLLLEDSHDTTETLRELRALGMRTVPEGVETQGRLKRLIALECDYVQGYHLGRPQPAGELEARLRRGPVAPSVGTAHDAA